MKAYVIAVVFVAAFVWVPPAEAAGGRCSVQTHRLGPTTNIDDNTLEGLARSTQMGARAEGDLIPLTDGFAVYHEHLWEQKTTGRGVPWKTSSAYADSLRTIPNGQQVPLLGEVLSYAKAHGSRVVFEIHQWHWPVEDVWNPTLLREVVDEVRDRGLLRQVWFTGTIPMMTALAEIAPGATTVWRVEADQVVTQDFIANRSVEMLQVPHSTSRAEVRRWRNWGVKVEGRRVDPPNWRKAYRIGLRSVQTNEPLAWLRFCRRQS